MQIKVTGRHVEITDALRVHAHDRVEHDLKEFPRIEHVHVIMDVEKRRQIAEVVIQGKNHLRLEADAESDSMYASVDAALEKAARQLRKSRDKIQHHKRGERLASAEPEAVEPV